MGDKSKPTPTKVLTKAKMRCHGCADLRAELAAVTAERDNALGQRNLAIHDMEKAKAEVERAKGLAEVLRGRLKTAEVGRGEVMKERDQLAAEVERLRELLGDIPGGDPEWYEPLILKILSPDQDTQAARGGGGS